MSDAEPWEPAIADATVRQAQKRREQEYRPWRHRGGSSLASALMITLDCGESLAERQALDFHPLRGDRRGQHALRLTGQMRLIVTVVDERTVRVEKVTDYHG